MLGLRYLGVLLRETIAHNADECQKSICFQARNI